MSGLQSAAQIPELRKRILFTLMMLAVYRIGVQVPTPGINSEALTAFFQQNAGTLFGMFNMFSGGGAGEFFHLCPGNHAVHQCLDYHAAAHCGDPPARVVEERG